VAAWAAAGTVNGDPRSPVVVLTTGVIADESRSANPLVAEVAGGGGAEVAATGFMICCTRPTARA